MSRSKAGYQKRRNMAGGGVGTDHIAPNKVKHFQQLFQSIRDEAGTHDGARAMAGLSGGAVDDLHKGKVSILNAKRILNTYNNLKGGE